MVKSIINKKGTDCAPILFILLMVCLILGDVMNILLLDNRDSFTYNIVNLIRKVNNHSFEVISVDDINLQKVAFFDKIIFSPKGVMYDSG